MAERNRGGGRFFLLDVPVSNRDFAKCEIRKKLAGVRGLQSLKIATGPGPAAPHNLRLDPAGYVPALRCMQNSARRRRTPFDAADHIDAWFGEAILLLCR